MFLHSLSILELPLLIVHDVFGKIGQTESVVLEVRTDAWDESTEQAHKEFLGRDARDSHPFACLFNMFFIEYPHEADSVLAPRGEMGLHRLYF